MAVTTEKSTEYNMATDPRTYGRMSVEDTPQKSKMAKFNFTQGAAAGDATSTAGLVYLPPGRYNIYWFLSRIEWSAFGASRVLDVGLGAYTAEDGTSTAAAANVADNDIDVSSAGAAAMGSDFALGSGGVTELKVGSGGVGVFATVAGGTIPAAATLKGYLVYTEVGP